MDRVAVFVDAGYLLAQGSVALAGVKQPRSTLILDEVAVCDRLSRAATALAGGLPLLRIYWYDGVALSKGPTVEHQRVARLDNVKLRFGLVTGGGEQKGVDSLIVTDLIELARNRGMCDAVLLAGDEDLRVGVEIAQSFGVRIHLIGIAPSRGSQSRQLLQEADTTSEWDQAAIASFLSIRPLAPSPAPPAAPPPAAPPADESETGGPPPSAPDLDTVATGLAAALAEADVTGIKLHWISRRGVPREFDGRLLASARAELGRDLTADEKRHLRDKFSALIGAR